MVDSGVVKRSVTVCVLWHQMHDSACLKRVSHQRWILYIHNTYFPVQPTGANHSNRPLLRHAFSEAKCSSSTYPGRRSWGQYAVMQYSP
jgi:hypothetical protein